MRWTRAARALLLTALALLALAAPAAAQRKGGQDIQTGDRGYSEVSGRIPGSPRDRAVNWQFEDEGDGYGSAHVWITPQHYAWLGAIQTKLWATGSNPAQGPYADSSAVLPMRGSKDITLSFSALLDDTSSTRVAVFAVSVRGHTAPSSDSLFTDPLWPLDHDIAPARDNIMAFSDSIGTMGRAGAASNELTAVATNALPYEILVVVYAKCCPSGGAARPFNRGIDVSRRFVGAQAYEWLSVRARLLRVYDTAGASIVGNAVVTASLLGSP